MPGADYILGGPVFWVVTGLLFVAGMLAAFVVIDAVRRARFPGSRPAEPLRWFFLVPQAVFLVLMLLGQGGAIPIVVTGIVVISTPLALAQGVAYLLRVVFPKPAAPEATEEEFELLADGGDTIEPESHASHPAP